MIKRNIFVGIFMFLIGVVISVIIDGFLRNIIQDLYQVLTNDSIYFLGRGLCMHPLPSFLQCVGFGFWVLIFWKKILSLDGKQKLWNGLLTLGFFQLALVLLCFLDSNLKVMECTMCDNGRLGISYSEINYEVLICLSLLVSILPIAIKEFIKRRKNKFQDNLEDVLDMEIEKL